MVNRIIHEQYIGVHCTRLLRLVIFEYIYSQACVIGPLSIHLVRTDALTQFRDANFLQILPCDILHYADGVIPILCQLFLVLWKPYSTEPFANIRLQQTDKYNGTCSIKLNSCTFCLSVV